MKFKKVLFIVPEYPGQHFTRSSPPIGIGYLAEVLKRAGVTSFSVDAGEHNVEGLSRIVQGVMPDLLAVSMMTFRYRHHYDLVRQLKEMAPQAHVVAGGPHISLFGSQVLSECPELDYVIQGEGELPLRLLCEGADLSDIPGLHYRKEGQQVFTGAGDFLRDLDSIPFPMYDGFLMKAPRAISLCSSRGCPFHCTFCQSTNLGKKWRARSPENVGEEMEYWYRRGHRLFDFIDDNLTLDRDRVCGICDEIDRRRLKGLAIGAAGVRADRVDRELLNRMKIAGFRHLSFGVEGGNDRILEILKKGESFAAIDTAVREATDLGFNVTLYFLVGSPYETLEDVRDSCKFALKYPVTDAFFSNLMPIPGTEIMEWIERHGRLLRRAEDYLNDVAEFEQSPLFDGPGMSTDERITALEMTAEARKEVKKRFAGNYAARRAREIAYRLERALGRVAPPVDALLARRMAELILRTAINIRRFIARHVGSQ